MNMGHLSRIFFFKEEAKQRRRKYFPKFEYLLKLARDIIYFQPHTFCQLLWHMLVLLICEVENDCCQAVFV